MKTGKFEIFKDNKNEFRFRLIARNGRIICQSEGYKTRQGVTGGIQAVQTIASFSYTDDLTLKNK